MSMDNTAIQLIQDTALAAQTPEGGGSDFPYLSLPNHMGLTSLEPYCKNKFRYKAEFKTSSIDSFVAYVTEHKGDHCYLDKECMAATTIFDLGTETHPEHGKHRAGLRLEKTELYKKAQSMDGSMVGQKKMAEFFEDYRESLTFQVGDESFIDAIQAITGVRNVTIESKAKSEHETHEFRGSRSAMEEVEANSTFGKLPAKVILKCNPYNGLKEYDIVFRLGVLTSHEKPNLVLRMVRPEQLTDAMVEEFEGILREKLQAVNEFFLGTLHV